MVEFITVFENHQEIMINLDRVEEIRPADDGKAVIYFAFRNPGCVEQDCIKTDESYGEVRRRILVLKMESGTTSPTALRTWIWR